MNMIRLKWTYLFLLVLAVAGCKKENDRAFDTSPDDRVNKVLDTYQKQLETSTYGWVASLRTSEGVDYNFFFRFNNQNRVTMYSDFTAESASIGKESSYRLKALQQVSLLFDTYSYIHVLADPDPEVADGVLGTGYGVDFEFYFDNATKDTINMVGRKHSNTMKLVRATREDLDYYGGGNWGKGLFTANFSNMLYYWKTTVINGVAYQLNADTYSHTITFTSKDANGAPRAFTTRYYQTSRNGIILENPLQAGNASIKEFTGITWNGTNSSINFVAGGNAATLIGNNTPVYVDVNAPTTFKQAAINAQSYWYSVYGFHIDGVDNAYDVTSLKGDSAYPNYYYYAYWPDYDPGIDLLAPIFVGKGLGLVYGAAVTSPAPTPAGVVKYGYYGTLNSNTPYPSTGPATNMVTEMLNTSGYYLVRTGTRTYDMVNVGDAKRWISWVLAN